MAEAREQVANASITITVGQMDRSSADELDEALKNSRAKICVSTDLEAILERVLSTENINRLASELGIEKGEN